MPKTLKAAALAAVMSRSLEDFELHKELYRGKSSLLYMATEKASCLLIALKIYRKRKLSTLNRFQVEREIRLHSMLDHPNVIRLYVAFEDAKNVYMVQEFAGNGDLFEHVRKCGGRLEDVVVAADFVLPFLNSINHLHSLKIIHRDIKPENILLSAKNTLKLADFGLSIDYGLERPVTRAGTLDYMAPEVLRCPDKRMPAENKDKKSLEYGTGVDVWAAGVLAYELLVGRPPFERKSRQQTYDAILDQEPTFPGWMTGNARSFITAALCKDPAKRCTIADLLAHPWISRHARRSSSHCSEAAGGAARLLYSSNSSGSLSAMPASRQASGKLFNYMSDPSIDAPHPEQPMSPLSMAALPVHGTHAGNSKPVAVGSTSLSAESTPRAQLVSTARTMSHLGRAQQRPPPVQVHDPEGCSHLGRVMPFLDGRVSPSNNLASVAGMPQFGRSLTASPTTSRSLSSAGLRCALPLPGTSAYEHALAFSTSPAQTRTVALASLSDEWTGQSSTLQNPVRRAPHKSLTMSERSPSPFTRHVLLPAAPGATNNAQSYAVRGLQHAPARSNSLNAAWGQKAVLGAESIAGCQKAPQR